ncbi:hypothetical protein EDD66_1056 [Mobilisporobacter senegalensis]|uniref:Uncharacterized protein n=1 Tax=Mobilisporobacter senegalensis TaxID=1329262 RepID=A0A3N1XP93_9FIRM|nr:hypothetical protein EDD66_1056 [Mobilisporobacter senegalensis]
MARGMTMAASLITHDYTVYVEVGGDSYIGKIFR